MAATTSTASGAMSASQITSSPATISLSLVSHTNAGKTTLARTLLGRDVGTVRDAPHVTEFADAFTLLQTPQGDTLRLWDTPGFGDSVRLAKRMRQAGNPLGWFLSEVWDRWRDRPFWSSQQALRNVREQADVVLYLVNAAEEPAAAGYVAPEMELLAWIGKPVVVLLNQLGAPREATVEEAEVQRWRDHLAPHAQVRAVLPLDAFARCWVQEYTLLQAICHVLPDADQRACMQRLADAWLAQRSATFDAAMQALAGSLARIAGAGAALPEPAGLRARLRQVGAALGVGKAEDGPQAQAQRALAEAMDAEVRASTAQLIALHGLDGQAQGEVLQRLATHFEARLRLSEGNAAMVGGVLTGALAGLKADIASGGFTLGGGMLAGGILGALGAAGLARGVNLVRGTERSWLMWNADALDAMLHAALLRYLAVAHFGRGRGEWAQGESPAHWHDVVAAAAAPYREAIDAAWSARPRRVALPAASSPDSAARGPAIAVGATPGAVAANVADAATSAAATTAATDIEPLAAELAPLLTLITLAALQRLYPGAAALDRLAPGSE